MSFHIIPYHTMLRMRVCLENSNMGGVTVLEGGGPACMAWSAGGYNTKILILIP